MENILVTGGAGYIGSHTCKLLHKAGYNPVTLDNLVYGHKEFVKWGKLYHGDQSDSNLVKKIINEYSIKSIIHFSAFAYVGESVEKPIKYFENNTIGTLKLVKVAIECGVKNFIFSSTCATYGIPTEIPIVETTTQRPINPYGLSKLMVEEMMKWICATSDLKFVALRYFNASGASFDLDIGERHNPETHLIPLVIDAALNSGTVSIFGDDYDTHDGTCIRDYIHVLDLADAHIKAISFLEKGSKSDIFNLGTGVGYSVKEIVDTVERISQCNINRKIIPRRSGDPGALISDPTKANKFLGWKPIYSSLDKIISSALAWHKNECDRI